MNIIEAADTLSLELRRLEFAPPVANVYNPFIYARASFCQYVEKYGSGKKEVLLLGMNPGPWGMAQTGIPFGEVNHVRDWLGINASIEKPEIEHPKRPVQGYDCTRSEVSGKRLWGWAKERFGTPESFFQRFFVINYCPLLFMEESGRNRTPDKLPAAEREALLLLCDDFLVQVIEHLQPSFLMGVGKFAEKRLLEVQERIGFDVTIGSIPHPSPANPQANRGWSQLAEKRLAEYGISVNCESN
jgi:single-strand selective monofunctional uracil DNA glycosylase